MEGTARHGSEGEDCRRGRFSLWSPRVVGGTRWVGGLDDEYLYINHVLFRSVGGRSPWTCLCRLFVFAVPTQSFFSQEDVGLQLGSRPVF